MCSGRASAMVTSPPARPTAARYVAATTRSGTTAWCVGRSSSTPSISMREVPAPRTEAPMSHSIAARSATSGSLAAFSITVVPLASTAAMSRLSVAVWLGYSSTTRVPTSRPPGTVPRTSPWEDSKRAPMALRPLMWKSIGRAPKSSPPGRGTRTAPQRARRRPRTTTDARMRMKSSNGPDGTNSVAAGVVTATAPSSSRSTRAPMARNTSAIVSTSLMRGTLESTVRPSANRQPAISLSAEFFAPPAVTVPRSGPLGSTTIWSALASTSPSIVAGSRPGREPRRADQLGSVPW